MSADSDFSALADRVLRAIGAALDAADADVDWTLNDGVLTIDCGADGKLIVNRHVPSGEIWVAARSGGFHFGVHDGGWRDTRNASALGVALGGLLRAQAGVEADFSALPAPPRAST
ncbi:MAG: iron donor protein CyaY [Casimicrobiaceae bacterium]